MQMQLITTQNFVRHNLQSFSPFDLVIDGIPVLGSLDDIAVILACLKLVESDLKDYEKWREENGKILQV